METTTTKTLADLKLGDTVYHCAGLRYGLTQMKVHRLTLTRLYISELRAFSLADGFAVTVPGGPTAGHERIFVPTPELDREFEEQREREAERKTALQTREAERQAAFDELRRKVVADIRKASDDDAMRMLEDFVSVRDSGTYTWPLRSEG